jgi:hypothetical protein
MTAKARTSESDGRKKSGESGALTCESLNGLKTGYREMGQINLSLAEEAVFSDEEAFLLFLEKNGGFGCDGFG